MISPPVGAGHARDTFLFTTEVDAIVLTLWERLQPRNVSVNKGFAAEAALTD